MKFSEMPYTRPDYAAAAKELDSLTARLRGAASAQEQVALYKEYETLLSHLSTQATLCSIRHTVDTRDAFYEEENNYNDEQAPLLEEKLQPFRQALLASPTGRSWRRAWASCCSRTWSWRRRPSPRRLSP